MKGVDYNKALSQERDYFKDTIKKTQDSAEKRIAANNEQTEHVMKKQTDTFIKDKTEIENNYKKNVDGLNEKTRETLGSTQSKSAEQLNQEREAFTQESLAKKKDFDQRLNEITGSYRKSFKSQADKNDDVQNYEKQKYDRNISSTKEDANSQLNRYKEDVSKSATEMKDGYNREQTQLVRSQEERLTDLQKEHGAKTVKVKNSLQENLEKTKEIQEAEKEQLTKYSGEKLDNLQAKYEDRFKTVAADYSQKTEKLAGTHHEEAVKANKENQTNLTLARRDFNKQVRAKDLEQKNAITGSGEFNDAMKSQQGLASSGVQEARVNNVKDQLAQTKKAFQEKAEKDQDTFNQTFQAENVENSTRMERALNQVNAGKVLSVSKEREKNEVKVANREHQNRLDKQAYEQQLMLERNNAGDRMSKLKENFTTSVKKLEEKHKVSLEDVTKTSNADKNEFVKKVEVARNNEVFELKREFAKMMDSTVQDYEHRLSTYQRDNDFLKQSMDQKIQSITDESSKQMETQRTLFEDRRSADVKNQQLLVDQKEHTLKSQMNQMSVSFQKKIDKITIDNESKLKLLTNDYENKLKELKALNSKEKAVSATNQQIELDRVKMAYEDEKNRTIQAYESQISSIKAGHRDQMDQMKDYKRLS